MCVCDRERERERGGEIDCRRERGDRQRVGAAHEREARSDGIVKRKNKNV